MIPLPRVAPVPFLEINFATLLQNITFYSLSIDSFKLKKNQRNRKFSHCSFIKKPNLIQGYFWSIFHFNMNKHFFVTDT